MYYKFMLFFDGFVVVSVRSSKPAESGLQLVQNFIKKAEKSW